MFGPVVVVEGNLELIGESVHDGGADAKPGKRTRATEKSDLGNIGPVSVALDEFVVNKSEDFFGHFVTGFPSIFVVVEAENTSIGRSVEVEFHLFLLPTFGGGFVHGDLAAAVWL